MPDLPRLLAEFGHLARVRTLARAGVTRAELLHALDRGLVHRPRRGWIAAPRADRDQLTAVAVGAPIGCTSALRRFGVWAGDELGLHLHAPSNAARVDPTAAAAPVGATTGVWHPSVPHRRRRDRGVRLASEQRPRVHWGRELRPERALDWVVSPQTALADAVRCMPAEHASAAIDSVLHERVLARSEVDAVLGGLPAAAASLVDAFTGQPESGVESLFVRRLADTGFAVRSQVVVPGHGRYDGVIDGCVLFEIDGRAHHSGSDEFFADRDRTLVGQSLGVPVLRPSARHVLEAWPTTLAAVARTVEDARIVRAVRDLPPAFG